MIAVKKGSIKETCAVVKSIANLLFEARILKDIPRSGFHFLGSGRESVAEHSFLTTFVGYVLAQMLPQADELKLLQMCLIHDLVEARTGDLNYVQKKYVASDESKALAELTKNIPFGPALRSIFKEFDAANTLEAQLAHDADQLALVLELKMLQDTGHRGPEGWLPHVVGRLRTEAAQKLAKEVLKTPSDEWWFAEKYPDEL